MGVLRSEMKTQGSEKRTSGAAWWQGWDLNRRSGLPVYCFLTPRPLQHKVEKA